MEPEPSPSKGRLGRHVRRGALALLVAIAALVGAGFAVTVFGAQTYRWRAFDVQVSIQPAPHGETRLEFAPLGEVQARTHQTPLSLNISLRNVSVNDLRKLVSEPPPRQFLERDFEQAAKRDLRDFALRQVALGALGALLAAAVLRLRRFRYYVFSGFWGAAFVALVFYQSVSTFDRNAFSSPRYTGSLAQADWIISLAKDAFVNAEALSTKLRRIADNVNTLYGRIGAAAGPPAKDTIEVLHISDIHNNLAAVNFVLELAEKSHVDIVINTGDLTDLGLPVETELSRQMARLKVPYLFVAGNHDSRATVAAVRKVPNAYVLDGPPLDVAGLRFLGSPDPSSLRAGGGDVNTSDTALDEAGFRLKAEYARSVPPPDVVAVHNPRQAEPLVGIGKLILCGHMHRMYVEERNGTVICNAGSTGAAGVRYFDNPQGEPFTACILAFARHPKPRLLYIDQVMLDGSLGSYSVSRRTF